MNKFVVLLASILLFAVCQVPVSFAATAVTAWSTSQQSIGDTTDTLFVKKWHKTGITDITYSSGVDLDSATVAVEGPMVAFYVVSNTTPSAEKVFLSNDSSRGTYITVYGNTRNVASATSSFVALTPLDGYTNPIMSTGVHKFDTTDVDEIYFSFVKSTSASINLETQYDITVRELVVPLNFLISLE